MPGADTPCKTARCVVFTTYRHTNKGPAAGARRATCNIRPKSGHLSPRWPEPRGAVRMTRYTCIYITHVPFPSLETKQVPRAPKTKCHVMPRPSRWCWQQNCINCPDTHAPPHTHTICMPEWHRCMHTAMHVHGFTAGAVTSPTTTSSAHPGMLCVTPLKTKSPSPAHPTMRQQSHMQASHVAQLMPRPSSSSLDTNRGMLQPAVQER